MRGDSKHVRSNNCRPLDSEAFWIQGSLYKAEDHGFESRALFVKISKTKQSV